MKQPHVGVIVIGLGVLFGRNNCAPQGFQQSTSSKFVVGEQSSGRVGKVEVSSSSSSSISTSSNSNFGVSTYQPQRQVQQVAPQYASNQNQRLQSVLTQQIDSYQQAQSQYQRELAQYRQLVQTYQYQQQTAAAQPQIQPRIYQEPQYTVQQYYQPVQQQQQYYQPVQQQQQYYQPDQQQPYYQSYNPYPQNNYYTRTLAEPPRRTSSSVASSLVDGIQSGLRSVTGGFGLGIGIIG